MIARLKAWWDAIRKAVPALLMAGIVAIGVLWRKAVGERNKARDDAKRSEETAKSNARSAERERRVSEELREVGKAAEERARASERELEKIRSDLAELEARGQAEANAVDVKVGATGTTAGVANEWLKQRKGGEQ